MNTENIFVRVSTIIYTSNSTMCISCVMSDESQWTCNMKGENWEMIKPSDFELSKKFSQRNQNENEKETSTQN